MQIALELGVGLGAIVRQPEGVFFGQACVVQLGAEPAGVGVDAHEVPSGFHHVRPRLGLRGQLLHRQLVHPVRLLQVIVDRQFQLLAGQQLLAELGFLAGLLQRVGRRVIVGAHRDTGRLEARIVLFKALIDPALVGIAPTGEAAAQDRAIHRLGYGVIVDIRLIFAYIQNHNMFSFHVA